MCLFWTLGQRVRLAGCAGSDSDEGDLSRFGGHGLAVLVDVFLVFYYFTDCFLPSAAVLSICIFVCNRIPSCAQVDHLDVTFRCDT